MKKVIKVAVLLLSFAFVLNSCTKDNDSGPNTGTLIIYNNSDNPYKLYVNGTFLKNQNGNSNVTLKKNPGIYTIRAVQISGYVLYPTDVSRSVSVIKDDITTVTYPF